jgi:phospholipid transport system substrate-binding protein
VQTYSARFSQYSGQTLRVVGRRPVGKNDTIVKTQLIRPQGAPVRIEWRVRDLKHKFLIIDIIVEGVSMAITQRDEFSSVIRRGGGDFNTLLTVLREKIGS